MMEHIVPGCKDADCKQSAVMIRHNGEVSMGQTECGDDTT